MKFKRQIFQNFLKHLKGRKKEIGRRKVDSNISPFGENRHYQCSLLIPNQPYLFQSMEALVEFFLCLIV